MAATFPTFGAPDYLQLARRALSYAPEQFGPPQYQQIAQSARTNDPMNAFLVEQERVRRALAQQQQALISQRNALAGSYASSPGQWGQSNP